MTTPVYRQFVICKWMSILVLLYTRDKYYSGYLTTAHGDPITWEDIYKLWVELALLMDWRYYKS